MKVLLRLKALGAAASLTLAVTACSSLAAQEPTPADEITNGAETADRVPAAYDDYFRGFDSDSFEGDTFERDSFGQTPTSLRLSDGAAAPSEAKPAQPPLTFETGMSASHSMAGAAYGAGCDTGCGDLCGDACCETSCDTCCDPCCWMHRFFVFGEALALRARNTEVAYAVPVDTVIPPFAGPPVQVGPVGVVDQGYEMGFRVGGGVVCDDFSSITAQFTWFESGQGDQIATNAPNVLQSLVHHPLTASAVTPWLQANARHDIELALVDVDYRHIFKIGNSYALNWLAGVRYAHLDQTFLSNHLVNASSQVFSNVVFDGAGIRVGLEGERVGRRGFMIYGKGHASFVAGEFNTTYLQSDILAQNEVFTTWQGARVVSILDLELGLGWYSASGRWRLSGGYLVSGWFNTVKTDDWIDAVRTNNFVDLNDSISFDGFVGRVEYRF
jgi:hypothetical protein